MTGPRGNRGGRSLRRDIRELCLRHFSDAIPKLVEMASGRVSVLLGYANVEELAEHFFELEQRAVNPDVFARQTWAECPEARKKMLVDIFGRITGGTLTQKKLAVSVGAHDMRAAIEVLGKFGLGTQTVITDDEENVVPGVLVLPPLQMERVQARQQRRLAAEEEAVAEDGLVYVEEDLTVRDRKSTDFSTDGIAETVSPAFVEIIKKQRESRDDTRRDGLESTHWRRGK
jgi:hypothetical protein